MDALKVSLTSEIWPECPVSPGMCWWFQITVPLVEILVLDPLIRDRYECLYITYALLKPTFTET